MAGFEPRTERSPVISERCNILQHSTTSFNNSTIKRVPHPPERSGVIAVTVHNELVPHPHFSATRGLLECVRPQTATS
ncbi:hypothetical protein PoB_007447300 [Plakobranchus ocellatus]|uniref:Uncharacterized protein n=1 Tax=Plakobranchus ocellatus TaxID=259542 RepID=A0AAV4DUD0_9GAST|nr:hypothetical protein PoB_007447300 [Plakobranchus ocellatus]